MCVCARTCACFVVVLSAAPEGGGAPAASPQELPGGRAGAYGLAWPGPAARRPQPGHAGRQPPGSCCLVDRSSRGSLVLSRRPLCHAGCGLCPRAALPFRIRTNRVLCQGAQRAPARGSPIFCWAGEGVFRSPVVSINDLVFLWWCSVFWPSPSPHRSSVCKSVVCHENDRAAQRVPVSFPFHLPAGRAATAGPPPQPGRGSVGIPAPPGSSSLRSPSGLLPAAGLLHRARDHHLAPLPAAARGSLRPRAAAGPGCSGRISPFPRCGGSRGAALSIQGYRLRAGHGDGDEVGSWVLREAKEDEALPRCEPG